MRTILVHLTVSTPDEDDRSPAEVADAIVAAVEAVAVLDGPEALPVTDLVIDVPLAEEV